MNCLLIPCQEYSCIFRDMESISYFILYELPEFLIVVQKQSVLIAMTAENIGNQRVSFGNLNGIFISS